MDKKIKVLVVPSDHFGCGLYRSVSPHQKLQELYSDEFEVEIQYEPDWTKPEEFEKYDIIHFHKGLFRDMNVFWNALAYFKEHNIVTIMDVDDNWELGYQHPLYLSHKKSSTADDTKKNLKLADYVTTTTHIFAKKIKPLNKNVFIYPNAVNPEEEQYQPVKNPCDRIRFGFVMGSSHEKDMEQMNKLFSSLGKEYLDKIQVVLCGYDLRGTVTEYNQDGTINKRRNIQPLESVWYRYEKNITDNYSIVSPNYKDFLLSFQQNIQWPGVDSEPYRREWTKDVTDFAKHYRNIDVLLVPLDTNNFNEVKSELKFVEAGFTRTAVIASNFGPYTIGSKNMFKYGGGIDEEGNCILIEPRKAHKEWAKAIKKLVDNPDLITLLQNNMYETVKDTYDIRNVTAKRAEWYKSIVKK